MNAPARTDDELELQRCEEEARRLEQQLAEARDRPRQLALEKLDRDNTLPPCDRLAELKRMRDHEAEIATRRETGNLQKAQLRSVLLLIMLGITIVALVAWGFRLMNG